MNYPGRSTTEVTRQTSPGTRAAAAGHRIRRDIQGLRAVAVALVLVYHLAPASLTGGYIGVDIFFVISGFLITGQLLREARTSGKIDLPRFWARRARRLLPAALLVLAVTLATVWLFAPRGYLPGFLQQVAASAAYVQNWLLAGDAVDYMAAESQASPVQHYWSLSVEEQFYILWPLVAVLALWLAARLGPRLRRGATPSGVFALLMGVIVVASLATSILLTQLAPAQAYFVTTTRAWEFAVGGLIAWAAASPRSMLERVPVAVRAGASWLGLAGLAACAVAFTDATAFPGWPALLPVTATALIVAAGEPETRWAPRFLATRPLQWLGDVSYGAYLWHFPILILAPFVLGRGIGIGGGVLVVAATLLLAWGSKVWVEDPFRTTLTRNWPNGRALAITSAGMIALLGIALVSVQPADQQVEAEQRRVVAELKDPAPCLGAAALDAESGCDPLPRTMPIPEPALADRSPERCLSTQEGSELEPCEYGASAADATRTIALVGDSHAEQWLPALEAAGEAESWRVVVLAKASCPFSDSERDFVTSPGPENERLRADCATWNTATTEYLAAHPEIDTVVTSAKSTNRVVSSQQDWAETATAGYETKWAQLPASVSRVVAVRDTPQMADGVMQCVSESGEQAGESCAVPTDEAFHTDPLANAAEQMRARAGAGAQDGPTVTLVDMSEYFVIDGATPPVIGGVLAFRDSHHLSWAYAEQLAAPFAERIEAAEAR